jgi:hypothetical protein
MDCIDAARRYCMLRTTDAAAQFKMALIGRGYRKMVVPSSTADTHKIIHTATYASLLLAAAPADAGRCRKPLQEIICCCGIIHLMLVCILCVEEPSSSSERCTAGGVSAMPRCRAGKHTLQAAQGKH